MNGKNPIWAAYQEVWEREVSELKERLANVGGSYVFNAKDAPSVLVHFDDWAPHSDNVLIGRVRLVGEKVLIDGSTSAVEDIEDEDWYDTPICIDDIAYGHVSYITAKIPVLKENLLLETIVQLSADIYKQVYDHCECYTEASAEIIRLAREFEKELNWQDDDERDYIAELEKFENEYLESIKD